MNDLTIEERAALLRATRERISTLDDEIVWLHALGARQGDEYHRKLAEVHTIERALLTSATRKLWLQQPN